MYVGTLVSKLLDPLVHLRDFFGRMSGSFFVDDGGLGIETEMTTGIFLYSHGALKSLSRPTVLVVVLSLQSQTH